MQENNSTTIRQLYVNSIKMQTYEFVLHYAEELCESVTEFPHHHALYQIYYVTEGTLRILVENSMVYVHPNELLFLAPDVKHHVLYEPYSKKSYFAMIYDFIQNQSKSLKGLGGELEYLDIENELIRIRENNFLLRRKPFYGQDILNNVKKGLKEKQIGWNTTMNFLYFRFFIKALRHIAVNQPKD